MNPDSPRPRPVTGRLHSRPPSFLIAIVLTAAATALALASCGGAGSSPDGSTSRASRDDPRSTRDRSAPVAVRVERLTRGSISATLTTTGDLQAEEWTDLVVRRAGIVEALQVEEGKQVQAGDVLLRLERSEAEIVFEQARVEEQEAEKRAQLARESVAESENQVEQARLAAEKANREYERLRKLSHSVVQQEELETRAYEQRRTRLAHAAAENALRQARINAAIADTAAAGSVLKRKQAKIDLDFCELRAPFAGVISARHVQRGQYLAANTRAFTVVDTHNLKIEVNLPQRYLPRLEPGLQVELTTETFPDRPFPAVLERISPVVGEKGTVKVTVRVRQDDVRLRPGMYVSATLVLDTHENTLLASKRGVQYDTLDGLPHVFAVRDGRAVKLPVLIGYRKPTLLEVRPVRLPLTWVPVTPVFAPGALPVWRPTEPLGLDEDDVLIVAGQDRLEGGEEVNVVSGPDPGDSAAEREDPDPAATSPGESEPRTKAAPDTKPAGEKGEKHGTSSGSPRDESRSRASRRNPPETRAPASSREP